MSIARDHNFFLARLVEHEILDVGAPQRILAALAATGQPLDTVIIELGLMREEVFAREAARFFETEFIPDPTSAADEGRCLQLGIEFLSANGILPGPGDDRPLLLSDPFQTALVDMIRYHEDRPALIKVGMRSAIVSSLAALQQRYGPPTDLAVGDSMVASEGDLERLRDFAQQAPIVRFVSRVAQIAFDEGATDIHFEPFDQTLRVRMRVDGDLKLIESAPTDLMPGIATRIKILAGLDISERRLPQDGRMRIAVRGQELDMRASVIPTIHGETIVLRVLDRSAVALNLPALGFDVVGCRQLERLANAPNGIFLITGPTGSGKTTTLYALISLLNKPDVKIFTVEDPVEYRLDGITQVQTNQATGLTFARALRSVLRQDPDIILVGEIRDRETAEIAMQAALTGHLVLSTLHTNSAVGAVTRLRDMGIDNYLISATVNGVLGQRLLRRLCACGGKAECDYCKGSGYRGRTVTYEVMACSEAIAAMISRGDSQAAIEKVAVADGMISLDRNALDLINKGVTSREEVSRVISLEGAD
jgi:general secretion pathway protein E